jgi:hypothetical protein
MRRLIRGGDNVLPSQHYRSLKDERGAIVE